MDMTGILPIRAPKKKRRGEEKTVFLLFRDGKLALHKRPASGLLAKLWEFPNVEGALDEAAARIVLAQWGLECKELFPLPAAKHIFTHVEWSMSAYLAQVEGKEENFSWVTEEQYEDYAIPSAFSAFSKAVRQEFAIRKQRE